MDLPLTRELGLYRLFCPRGVAVVGSMGEGKLGFELVGQIAGGGFKQVIAVNPKARGACGAPGYAAIADHDGPIDVAIVAAPAASVPQVLEDCAAAGVRTAVIISAGFSEAGNAAGEEEVKRIAKREGIRIVGPNCAGIVNTHQRLYASLETRPPAGSVSFVSQSGAIGGAVLSWAEEQGLGFAKFLSYGNRADLDEIDVLPYLAADPETEAAAVYIESVPDGRRFLEAVRAFTRVKPLVVIKSGRSQAGRRATLSHTGSLAGADAVYDAALRDAGAIRVDSVEEMFDLCKGFVSLPPVKGRRIAIVTNSGGPAVLAADRAERVGLSTPEPSPALHDRLCGELAGHCALGNPIDLTVEATEATYRDTLAAVLGEYDAALALDVSTPYLDSVALARGVGDAVAQTDKPVAVNFMAGRIVAGAVAHLAERGIPNFATAERGVTVLARMAEYSEARERLRSQPEEEDDWPGPSSGGSLPGSDPMLEPEAMAWLGENGLPVPEFRWATDAEDAVEACRVIGYPVVMKLVSADALHKSEAGGVVLDIAGDSEARAAFAAIRERARGKDFRGVVVYPMVRGAHEVLLGVSHDPQFGPVVAFGSGGIYAEVLRDVSLRLAPVTRAGAEAMIREIRAFPILQGARGKPGCDLDALADALVRLSWLPLRYPEIAEIDVNPLFAGHDRIVVGDVRVIRKGQPS